MIVDFRSAALLSRQTFDVIVVGAGAVGTVVAHELSQHGITVGIVERGPLLGGADTNADGFELVGRHMDGMFERGWGCGGTTSLWGGQCMRFAAEDFTARPWVTGSGWPISKPDLDPFYERAEAFLGIRRIPAHDRDVRLDLSSGPLQIHNSVFAPQTNLGQRIRSLASKQSSPVTVVLGGQATNISGNGHLATGVRVAAEGGGAHRHFYANCVVLAAGAIENARLLLAPSGDFPEGLNDGGLVGQHLQDHPTAVMATINAHSAVDLQTNLSLTGPRRFRTLPKISLSPSQQATQGVLNAGAVVAFEYPESSMTEQLRQLANAVAGRRFDSAMLSGFGSAASSPFDLLRLFRARTGRGSGFDSPSRIAVHVFGEQEPLSSGSVTLSNAYDRYGMPAAKVDWRVSPFEVVSMRTLLLGIRRRFSELGLGDLYVTAEADESIADSKHASGTTRMGVTARDGVVDQDCRAFSLPNVFVGGGSVFPTSSFMNPTLTMMALAFRLSDTLRSVLRRGK